MKVRRQLLTIIISVCLLSGLLPILAQAAATNPTGDPIGSFWGIVAKSNGPNTTTPVGDWQCVEYVKRFYHDIWGIDTYNKWRGDACTYDSKPGLTFYPNGTSYTVPQPGDILVYSKGLYGHVAIVMSLSTATGQMQLIHQNWSRSTAYMPVTANIRWVYKSGYFYAYVTVPAMGSYICKGWSRSSLQCR